MAFKLLKSKPVIFLIFGVLVFTISLVTRQLQKKYQVEKEIRLLKEEMATLEGRNKDIQELINYFQTPEYKERQARSLLNLQKEGEFAVALPLRHDAEEAVMPLGQTKSEPNYQKWIKYFLTKHQ